MGSGLPWALLPAAKLSQAPRFAHLWPPGRPYGSPVHQGQGLRPARVCDAGACWPGTALLQPSLPKSWANMLNLSHLHHRMRCLATKFAACYSDPSPTCMPPLSPCSLQIRDLDTHLPLPGIMVGDIGPKMGCAGTLPCMPAAGCTASTRLGQHHLNITTVTLAARPPAGCSALPAPRCHAPWLPQLQQRGQRLPQV